MVGVEHLVTYLWRLWVLNGRKAVAKKKDYGWQLRITGRYRYSLVMVLLFSAFLVWLCLLSNNFESGPERNVIGGTLLIIFLMAAYGTLYTFTERVNINILGIECITLFRKKSIEWTAVTYLSLDNSGEKIYVHNQTGNFVPISLFSDGLGTFLKASHYYIPIPHNVFISSGISIPEQVA